MGNNYLYGLQNCPKLPEVAFAYLMRAAEGKWVAAYHTLSSLCYTRGNVSQSLYWSAMYAEYGNPSYFLSVLREEARHPEESKLRLDLGRAIYFHIYGKPLYMNNQPAVNEFAEKCLVEFCESCEENQKIVLTFMWIWKMLT
jgi:hypothetical protein